MACGGSRRRRGPTPTIAASIACRTCRLVSIVAASSRQVAAPLSLARESRDGAVSSLSDGALSRCRDRAAPGRCNLARAYTACRTTARRPPPESDRLSIYPPTFHPAGASLLETITVAIRSGEERERIDLQLRPVRTVRVSGALNGPADMLAMRRLRLVPQDTDVLDTSEPVTTTDGRGAFVFPAVAPGRCSLRTTTCGLNGARAERTLHWADVPITVAAEDVDGVDVTLRPGLIVSGTLVFDGQVAEAHRRQPSADANRRRTGHHQSSGK